MRVDGLIFPHHVDRNRVLGACHCHCLRWGTVRCLWILLPNVNVQGGVPQISISEMRRVSSYGGPYGVAGSERLRQKLSLTPGLHLLSNSSQAETGFLSVVGDSQDERVFHRTYGAARNFYAIASNLTQVAKRESWLTRKDPFGSVVKETIVLDEPVGADEHCNGGAPAVPVSGNHSSSPGQNDNGTGEGGVEAFHEVSFNDSHVVEVVDLDKSTGTSSSADHLFGLSDSHGCGSSLLETRQVAVELQGQGPDLETEQPSITLAGVEDSLSTSPICGGQDAQISREGKCGAATAYIQDILSNEKLGDVESGVGLQNSENYRAKDISATDIQRHWRGWHERKYFREVKGRIVFLQSLVRRNQLMNQYHAITHSAVVLQKYWRVVQSVQALKRLKSERALLEQSKICNAAIVVQKCWRSVPSRRLLKNLRKERDVSTQLRNNHAAVVLQSHWRAQRGRCLVKHLKVEHAVKEKQRFDDAAVVVQKYWRARRGRFLVKQLRTEQVVREQQRIHDATTVLQKCWRAHQGRRLVELVKLELAAREQIRIDNAAIVLQKHWRANQCRSYVKNLKLEQLAREQHLIAHAAIMIQKHWRAQQARGSVNLLRTEQGVRERQIIDQAAIVIQKHCRAHQARFWVNQFRTEHVLMEKQKVDQAALVLQKHWRGRCVRVLVKHMRIELAVKELQKIDHAAIMLQKLWRARQSRGLVEQMRMEQLVKQMEMDDAATVLQKHWRGRQSRCLVTDLKRKLLEGMAVLVAQKCWRAKQSRLIVKHLKFELAARERHRARAATTLQKHWRARQSILLVKRLKMEAAVQDQQRLDNAATICQKRWRGRYSRLLLKHLKNEQALKELERASNAALALQKYWRRSQSQQLVKFLLLQRAAISAVSIQHASPSSSDEKQKIQAIIVLQAYTRGFVARRRLGQIPKPSTLSAQSNHTSSTTFTDTTSPRMMLGGSDLYAKCLCEAEDGLESSPSSSVVHHVDAGIKSVDQTFTSPINPLKHYPYASQGLDGEFSATSVSDVQTQKNVVEEVWNYVAVDQLEECLDTCLAALRPVPSESRHSLPGLDVPEKSHQFIAMDHNVKDRKCVDEVSTSTYEPAQGCKRTRSHIGESDNESSNIVGSASGKSRMLSNPVTSQPTPIGGTDDQEVSSGSLQETGSQRMENPVQGRNLGRQTLKQNEQRLKQFAQVFLLQRHIALQQQRAQAAPPFPPPMSSGSEIPSQMVNQPLEDERREQGEVAVDSTSVHTREKFSQVDAGTPKEDHVVCEIADPSHEQTASRNAQAPQNSCAKQIVERPGPDVVLDMVLLLRRIEAEYGTSEAGFEGESSTWCTSGCGDIEEGIPLLGRNLGSIKRESSVAKFANAVSMKHISIPDVNALLLVFIAMVVYTRTVCKGLFVGARQTHRRP